MTIHSVIPSTLKTPPTMPGLPLFGNTFAFMKIGAYFLIGIPLTWTIIKEGTGIPR